MKAIYRISLGFFVSSVIGFGQELAQPNVPETRVETIERGENFAVIGQITSSVDEGGNSVLRTNRVTVLENAMHYFDGIEWKVSEDSIDSFSEGAVARRGPNKAVFSHDLNVPAVFDIEMSDGKRVRGGVRAIQATDLATGKSVVLGTVREQAPGELLPPHQIVFRDAFEGSIRADVVLVWKRYFAQDVVLRSRPNLPAGMSGETTVLEIVSEFIEAPEPELRKQVLRRANQPDFEDDAVVHFGRMAMIPGNAFAVDAGRGYILGWNPEQEGTRVQKQWHQLEDGRKFLLESIPWNELAAQVKDLAVAEANVEQPEVMSVRIWPEERLAAKEAKPLQLASAAYEPQGYVVDFVLLPDAGTTVFASDETYIVRTTYYLGTSATFMPRCVIKFWGANGANLTLYGSISFPDSADSCVFTSIDDDTVGEIFPGNSSPWVPASDGNPADNMPEEHLRVWYVDYATLIRSALFRWGKNGIEYWNTGTSANHTIQNSRFEKFHNLGLATAITVGIPAGNTVSFVNSTKCELDQQSYITSGSVIGALSEYCPDPTMNVLVNNPAESLCNDPAFPDDQHCDEQNSQFEPSIAVVNGKIIVAYVDSYHAVYGLGAEPRLPNRVPRRLGYSVSSDNGASFQDKDAPPAMPYGDAGDPVLAVDKILHYVYLAGTSPRSEAGHKGIPFWKSTDGGVTFGTPINVRSEKVKTDKPWIAVDNAIGTGRGDVYLTFSTFDGAQRLWLTVSTDFGVNWSTPQQLQTDGTSHQVQSAIPVVGSDHTAYVFWLEQLQPTPGNYTHNLKVRRVEQRGAILGNTYTVGQQLVTTDANNGNLRLKLSNSAEDTNHFNVPAFPVPAVNPSSSKPNHLYVAYADKAQNTDPNDRADVFLVVSTDGGATWSGRQRISSVPTNDQWMPALAVKPDGTKLFTAWYDRRNDVNNNSLIDLYGRWWTVESNGSVTPGSEFRITTVSFPPAFAGTFGCEVPAGELPSCVGYYDPVYPPLGVNLKWRYPEWPSFDILGNPVVTDDPAIARHVGEYNGVYAEGPYVYIAWGDNRIIWGYTGPTRNQSDIRLHRIAWP